MSKTNCPNCGAPIDGSKRECPYCGTMYSDRHYTQYSITADGITLTSSGIKATPTLRGNLVGGKGTLEIDGVSIPVYLTEIQSEFAGSMFDFGRTMDGTFHSNYGRYIRKFTLVEV